MIEYGLGFLWLAIIVASITILEGEDYLTTIFGLVGIAIALFLVVHVMDRMSRRNK